MTCKDCKYQALKDGVLTCRRNAPKPGLKQHEEAMPKIEVIWPIVKMDDWCGEHEPANTQL